MTVRELKHWLENFDDDMKVKIGMQQTYGTDWAMEIMEVEERNVTTFLGSDYRAVVITEGRQCGTVDYEEEF